MFSGIYKWARSGSQNMVVRLTSQCPWFHRMDLLFSTRAKITNQWVREAVACVPRTCSRKSYLLEQWLLWMAYWNNDCEAKRLQSIRGVLLAKRTKPLITSILSWPGQTSFQENVHVVLVVDPQGVLYQTSHSNFKILVLCLKGMGPFAVILWRNKMRTTSLSYIKILLNSKEWETFNHLLIIENCNNLPTVLAFRTLAFTWRKSLAKLLSLAFEEEENLSIHSTIASEVISENGNKPPKINNVYGHVSFLRHLSILHVLWEEIKKYTE